MCRRFSDRTVLQGLAVAIIALLLPLVAEAAPDAAMRLSLEKFFSSGIKSHGAVAELISVERWPDARGAMNWSLPSSLRNHPRRFSLLAEQGDRRWYIPVRVHWWATAIVMNRSVSARSLLLTGMLKRTRADIAGHRGYWWKNASELKGMRLTRPLKEGDVIFSSYVKQPPLIKRGEIVQIILDAGHLHIRAEGKALRSARKGESIRVKNLRSQETVQAIAENQGTVRIKLYGSRG